MNHEDDLLDYEDEEQTEKQVDKKKEVKECLFILSTRIIP